MDLMVSKSSVVRFPLGHARGGRPLPYYSRFATTRCNGVDVLSQDVRYMLSTRHRCFRLCFPPIFMGSVLLQHLVERKARAVILSPTCGKNSTLC